MDHVVLQVDILREINDDASTLARVEGVVLERIEAGGCCVEVNGRSVGVSLGAMLMIRSHVARAPPPKSITFVPVTHPCS